MSDNLVKTLSSIGKKTEVYESVDGSRLLLLPYGARILGLYAAENDENFYWVNHALEQSDSARTLFESKGWQNTGGDRTWVTPELDIFFPDYPRVQKHWEPPQLDASEYRLEKSGDGVQMGKTMTLHFARPCRDARLKLVKWVGPASNPIRYEGDMQEHLKAVQYAGYTQRTTLELTEEDSNAGVQAGVWNLIQLPHGGDLLVPTYSKTEPRILFGDIPPKYLICGEHLVRFRVCFPGEHKIALRTAVTTGRVGYLYSSAWQWSLVIRNFFVNPSGEYVDVPKNEPEDLGYSVNAVNVDSALGDFCELEYHAPAVGHDTGQSHCVDVSQVWAFRGSKESINAIARGLLGAGIEL